MLIIKVFFSYIFSFGYLVLRCLLSFLDYPMSSNDQSILLCVPKREKSITNAIVESTKLPNIGILQFLEYVNLHHTGLNFEYIIVYFLLSLDRLRIQKSLRLFSQNDF